MANDFEVAYDGLICPEVGSWASTKYRLVSMYSQIFATSMKHRWAERVYVDLYAGAGYSRIRDTDRRLAASPILALTVKDPFDKYIFCEEDAEKRSALAARVLRHAPSTKPTIVPGNCNTHVEDVLRAIPLGSADHKVLSLCFMDPYDVSLRFETIQRLSKRYVDFLVLLALYMDANRNYDNYLSEDSSKIDNFLGDREWRNAWNSTPRFVDSFPHFLAEQFSQRMADLGYIPQPLYNMKLIRTGDRQMPRRVPLYYLALFSRNRLAYDFWEKVLHYGTDQASFDFARKDEP